MEPKLHPVYMKGTTRTMAPGSFHSNSTNERKKDNIFIRLFKKLTKNK